MKPINIDIDGVSIVITHLEVSESGDNIDIIDIIYDHDGTVNEDELSIKLQNFISEAIENSVKGIDV